MCCPVVIPNTSPLIGPVDKNGKQTISIYGNDDTRRTYVVDCQTVDNYLNSRRKASIYGGGMLLSAIGAFMLQECGRDSCKDTFKDFFKDMNWKKYGALGFAGLSLALIPKTITSFIEAQNAREAITKNKYV